VLEESNKLTVKDIINRFQPMLSRVFTGEYKLDPESEKQWSKLRDKKRKPIKSQLATTRNDINMLHEDYIRDKEILEQQLLNKRMSNSPYINTLYEGEKK